ncbi:MAG: NAD(+)/NADH kinase, partial [Acidobacteria bacterium]|nr:NAD(+)/NADH kinase [Acidobacteriota bacterium]
MIQTYKDAVLIYNPRAGRILRSDGSLIHRAEKALRDAGHRVTPAPTTGPRTAGEIARKQIARGADLIVVAGGDGTVNEAAEGMVGSEVPLAVLPAGTANVLATEMKLGRDPVQAARRLHEWQARGVAAGRLTFGDGQTRHFLLMAGIGLDAHIVGKVNPGLKARTGKFAYWVAGWSLVGRRLAQFEVEIEGVKRTCGFALFARVRNYGGDFEIARQVTLLEDSFEVVLFEGRSALRFVPYFAGMVMGRLEGRRGVTVLRAREAAVRSVGEESALVQIDGELG